MLLFRLFHRVFLHKVANEGRRGVGRVPYFQSKFNDVPAWMHPDFNLISQKLLTKPEREGLRLPAPTVPALPPPPPSKEAERVSSSSDLPSAAPVSGEVVSFKGMPLARVRKKRKQRENPRLAAVASLPPALPSQERRVNQRCDHSIIASSDHAASSNKLLQVYVDPFMISFICSLLTIFLLFSTVTDTAADMTEAPIESVPPSVEEPATLEVASTVPTRDGNGSDLDRVQVVPDPNPFSRIGSRSGPRSAGPVLQDPDPDPRILRIQYRIRVQNGSDLFLLLFIYLFLNVLSSTHSSS